MKHPDLFKDFLKDTNIAYLNPTQSYANGWGHTKGSPRVALSVKPLPPNDEVAEHRFLELLDALADIPTSREADVIPVGTAGDFFLEFRGEGNV